MNRRWTEWELPRRAVHTSGVLLPLAYVTGVVDWAELGLILAIGALSVTLLEFARLSLGFNHRIYDRLTRPYEQQHIAGYALYMFGMAGTWLLFSPAVALAGMLMLIIGDPVSGILSSATADETKRTPVLIAMFVTCILVAVPLTSPESGVVPGTVVAAAGALGATLSDGASPTIRGRVIDDNLTIPLVSSLCMTTVLLLV